MHMLQEGFFFFERYMVKSLFPHFCKSFFISSKEIQTQRHMLFLTQKVLSVYILHPFFLTALEILPYQEVKFCHKLLCLS